MLFNHNTITQSHIHMCHVSEKFIICFAWLRQQFKLRPVAKTLLFCFCVCVYILLLFLCRTSQSAICILNANQTHFIHWCDEFWLNTNAIAIRSHANINVEVANKLIYFSNSMGLGLLESFQQKLSLDSLDGHRISMSLIPLEQIFLLSEILQNDSICTRNQFSFWNLENKFCPFATSLSMKQLT